MGGQYKHRLYIFEHNGCVSSGYSVAIAESEENAKKAIIEMIARDHGYLDVTEGTFMELVNTVPLDSECAILVSDGDTD